MICDGTRVTPRSAGGPSTEPIAVAPLAVDDAAGGGSASDGDPPGEAAACDALPTGPMTAERVAADRGGRFDGELVPLGGGETDGAGMEAGRGGVGTGRGAEP
jgi:hypothetical protein